MKLSPYLHFDGHCETAFKFYAHLLGGEIVMLMKNSEAPAGCEMPGAAPQAVMHVCLQFGDQMLMGSDAPPGWYTKPQGLVVSLHVDSLAEAERIFGGLAEGGEIRMPLQQTFWAARFGMLADRFGTPWMINLE